MDTVMIRFSSLLPISAPFRISAPIPFSAPIVINAPILLRDPILIGIIIFKYGYLSTEVHLPLIAHKRTVMPHYKNYGRRLSFSTIMSM